MGNSATVPPNLPVAAKQLLFRPAMSDDYITEFPAISDGGRSIPFIEEQDDLSRQSQIHVPRPDFWSQQSTAAERDDLPR
ncbi:hypothetical protein [Actibacterium sp. 188UL27-1]|uniref:hypothetical protein n=1 Tax=Actibacterium sp. 188UL27-1 TaxID=2786961 RepID=UPI00195601B7|nr:hypothetical protein [Actibacterium sp. 188UL27-1]MBM7067895.1 hypothetical protein [Actibacterium sp. 188UL27-1]